MSELRYTVLFEPAEEGGYVVTCPALPGLVTEGDNYEQAHERVIEAIEGYLESLQKDDLPFPPDKKLSLEPVKEEIKIALPEPAEPAFSCSPANTGCKSSPESRFLYSPHQRLTSVSQTSRQTELRVTIPLHNTDLKQKTLASIIKQAVYMPEDFLKLL